MRDGWYKRRWFTWLIHILAWTLLFFMPALLRPNLSNTHPAVPNLSHYFYQYSINFLAWVILFYVNAFILVPKFINKRKYGMYFLLFGGIMIVCLGINYLSFRLLLPNLPYSIKGFALFFFFPSLFFLAMSTAYKILSDRTIEEQQVKEKETENLKTELSFLRSQVSPHFMFNILNNMVALARKKSDLLEPSLIKLSSLLRYMLYETSTEEVPLNKEIEYLQSYIDLQLQRFGKNVEVQVCMKETDRNYYLEPMLLIPFVENAFKHGTGLIENAYINIKLSVKDNELNFIVKNRYLPKDDEIKDKSSGIGLSNVKRRLNLLYAGNHTLEIIKENGEFIARLNLKLH
ncbi:MAG: sensor histidine kinase [Flavisolibacter sp.]